MVQKSTVSTSAGEPMTRRGCANGLAYVLRYRPVLRQKVKKETEPHGPFTQQELALSETIIFRSVQREEYPDEAAILTSVRNMRKLRHQELKLELTSKIRKLSPFMDEFGVIRAETRISEATFAAHDTRFPIILPKDHKVTRLVIKCYYQRFLHANNETIVNEIRQRFHVSTWRTVVRKISRGWLLCKLKRAASVVPRMAPLPAARLKAFERSFSYVGIDYFGPIAIRVNRSNVKKWVASFTCLTTRAVHLCPHADDRVLQASNSTVHWT
ncbi:uncharacterized protein LOC131687085 [Topomyia yanbarensis]|uniref:uncharacterized protein LOC131687085 n=1 Tax=Topomyia yanbarensis TaxID=2498891 RepID=UPI00273CD31A|nr:uncharacterized protein LOC131687085 [Topomyia yanbarensis]